MNIKEGTFVNGSVPKPNIESTSIMMQEYENASDEGRSTLSSSATIESHLIGASGVIDFMHAKLKILIAILI